jgi:hypothetical protein
MLAGFLLVLSSSRVPQMLHTLTQNDPLEKASHGGAAEASERPVGRQFYRLEVLLVGCLVAGSTLMFLLPPVMGALLMVVMALLIPAVLTVLIVYTKGWRRAFCIGAILPAGTVMLFATIFLLLTMFAFSDRGYRSSNTNLRYLMGFQACALGGWFLTLVSGTLASLLALILQTRDRG